MKKVIQSTMMACLALVFLCLASCNDDAIVEMSQSAEMGQPFRLTATQETPSRLALGQDGLSVTWEPGDQLVLVKKDRSIVPIYMNAELDEPSASATFVSETGVPAGEYYVIYNYNENLAYTHRGFSSIDEINNNDKLVLWGELTVANGTSSATISLQHLYAKVRVELQNVPSSSTWYQIGMYASKSGFPVYKHFVQTGMVDADYVYDATTWSYSYKQSRRKYHNIRLGNYNMQSDYTDEMGEFHPGNKSEIEKNAALVLPADVSDGTVYFYILYGNECYEIAKSNLKFEPGKSYKVVLDMANATKTTLNTVQITMPGNSYSSTFYQLASPEDCRHAAYRGSIYSNYILMNDIDFQDNTFLPLTARNLLGNDKTLKNVSVEWNGEDYVGLVKYDGYYEMYDAGNMDYINRLEPMSQYCFVSDLTLENVQIKGHSYVGALSATNIKADNCKIKGESAIIGQGDYVGGFVGCNRFTTEEYTLPISNSSIETCSVKGNNYVGGIVGKYTNLGNYTLHLYSSLRLLNSCSSAATTEATGNYVGGIFGGIGDDCGEVYFNSEDYVLSLYQCINTGSVKGKDYVGGIGGYFGLYSWSSTKDQLAIMQSCSEGNVSGENYVGGIVGENLAFVNLCYSIGDISAATTDVGGIIGRKGHATSYVSNCYSMANLAVGNSGYSGGIVGYVPGSAAPDLCVENCYFAGTNATGFGIVGYSDGNTYITNCLTTLSSLIDQTNGQPTSSSNALTGVTSILQNKNVINGENAYSDNVWTNYNYECVMFATGLTGNVTAPGFGTETIY